VEYEERDPCWEEAPLEREEPEHDEGLRATRTAAGQAVAVMPAPVVEAAFTGGEYTVTALPDSELRTLQQWLLEHGYRLPARLPRLASYVEGGWRLLIFQVDAAKVTADEQGVVRLSPVRYHYDAETPELPLGSGTLEPGERREHEIYVLGRRRYEAANYPNVTVPTNLDVAEAVSRQLGAFYRALLARTWARSPGAVITELAWVGSQDCEPCPPVASLSRRDLLTLGGDVVPGLYPDSTVLTRLRLWQRAGSPDRRLRPARPIAGGRECGREGQLEGGKAGSSYNSFQARYAIRRPWTGAIACRAPLRGQWQQRFEPIRLVGRQQAAGAGTGTELRLENVLMHHVPELGLWLKAPERSRPGQPPALAASGGCATCQAGGSRVPVDPRLALVALALWLLAAGARRRQRAAAALCVSLALTGCARRLPRSEWPPPPPPEPVAEPPNLPDLFRWVPQYDELGYTEEICGWLVPAFEKRTARLEDRYHGPMFPELRYDIAAVLVRCDRLPEAQKVLKEILAKHPDHHLSRVLWALNGLRLGRLDLAGAIAQLQRAIRDAKYNNAPALVHLARLQLRRNNDEKDSDGSDDRARALKNIYRAFVVDPQYALLHQLHARFQLTIARAKAQRLQQRVWLEAPPPAEPPAFAHAASTTRHEQQLRPDDAVIVHTLGLILVEQGDLDGAAQAFARASRLAPALPEPARSLGSVSLALRDFEQAEAAYRRVLELTGGGDYDALVGLAAALRGQASGVLGDEGLIAEATQLLERAAGGEPARPEAHFNLGLLLLHSTSSAASPERRAKALDHLRRFVQLAGADPSYQQAVGVAQARLSQQ